MYAKHLKLKSLVLFALILAFVLLPLSAIAATTGTYTPTENVTVAITKSNSCSYSNGSVTITAKGTAGFLGIGAVSDTATATITVAAGGTLSFDYALTNVNTLTIDGNTITAKGSFQKAMQANGTISIEMTTEKNSTENKVVLSNFKFVEAAAESTVTVLYDSGNSVKIGESIVSSGYSTKVTQGNSITLTASTSNFVAWIDADTNMILSKSSTYVCTPTGNMTVRALHGPNACFETGGKMYASLAEATKNAASGSIIILANNGTLPAGDYTIPSGVTLLIPYAENTDAYTDPLSSPEQDVANPTTPTLFRKLIVSKGTVINCNGNIRVDAQQNTYSNNRTGCVSGKYGRMELEESAVLNMNNGSSLRAYGYITGKGTVNCTGSTVYELFQIMDWRGGSAASSLKSKLEGHSFLISQFYIQNIETTLTLNSDCKLVACATISTTNGIKGTYRCEPVMVGSGGLFRLADGGSVSRTFSADGRVNYVVDGDLTLGSVSIEFTVGLIPYTISSSEYVLTFPANMTVTVNSGTANLDGSFKLQPGAKWVVSKGATLNLNSGAELIIYDHTTWNAGNYARDKKYYAVNYSPTKKMDQPTQPGQLVVDGTLNVNSGAGVYITTGQSTSAPLLTGTGVVKIDSNADLGGRTKIKEVNGNTTNLVEVDVKPLEAFLCSAPSTFNKMDAGTTYTGDGKVWHVDNDSNCICDVDGCNKALFRISGATLLFKDDIQINILATFNMYTTQTLSSAGLEVFYESDYNNGSGTAPSYTVDEMSKNGQYYTALTHGIAAKNMADVLYIRAYLEVNGTKYYTDFVEYSPQIYCKNKIEKSSDENLRSLCIALMNYGAAAQKYFGERDGFKYDTLMNDFLSEDQKKDLYSADKVVSLESVPAYSFTAANTDSFKVAVASTVMTGALKIRLSAIVPDGATSVQLLYWRQSDVFDSSLSLDKAQTVNMTYDGTKYYQADIEGIAAKNMGETVYFCVKATVNDQTSYTAVKAYSIHKYAQNKAGSTDANMSALAKALVVYSDAAKTYFINK